MTTATRRPAPPEEPTIDRLPPHQEESEQAVLGSILIDRDAIHEALDEQLEVSDFYRQGHGLIYGAMKRLYDRGEVSDVVTVSEELERAGELKAVGGASYLSTLGNDTPTAVHVAQYARIVHRKAVLRRMIQAAGRIAAIGYEDGADVDEAIQRAESELAHVRLQRGQAVARDFKLDKRGLGYFLTWPTQQIELTFTKLKHRSSDTTADVLITCKMPGLNLRDGHLSMGRQNLSAPKGRMDFARGLQRRIKDERAEIIEWEDVIERSFVAVLVAESKGEPIVDIDGWDEAPEFRSYALDPVAPRGEPTILFAPGGTGKSYLSLALALSVQLGREIVPGIPPAMTGPVLYLDWETNAKTVKTRIRKIAGGSGFDPPRIAYRRCTAPLADDAEQLSTEIAKRGIVLVVIDSAGAAIGSQGEYGDANEGALRFFEAIRVLGSDLTVLVIDHVAKPGPVRKGQQPTSNPYGCYAADTEVLTRNGWLTHDQLDPETDVLAFDPESERYKWERPTAYHAYPFSGRLHHWDTKVSNAMVTPNHRMIVSPGWPSAIGAPWRFVQADQITTADWLLAASGESPAEVGAAVDQDWAMFLGWYIAEGSASGSAVRMCMTEPFASRVRPVLARMFPDVWEKTYRREPSKPITHFVMNGQPELVARLRAWGVDAGSKCLPAEVFGWDLPQRVLLLAALMEGDGHQNGPGAWTYATKSEQLADDVQRLAILNGLHADVHPRDGLYKGAPYRSYHVSITEKRSTWFRPGRSSRTVPYEGMVYCLTVPSGAYVTRLDGRMAIHGNSVYKTNAARSVWRLDEAGRGEDDVTCSLRHTKVNDSKMYRPITYRLIWSPDGVTPETATFELADYIAEPGSKGGSVADRAVEFIGSGRQSTSAIAMALGASLDTVRRSCNRDDRLVRMGNDWMLADNAPIPMNQVSEK